LFNATELSDVFVDHSATLQESRAATKNVFSGYHAKSCTEL